jgi:hypothetical protein
MNKEEVKKGILHFILQGGGTSADRMGHTLLDIKKFLSINEIDDYSQGLPSWKRLRLLLLEMEEEGLLEERHFDEGRVDYVIQEEGCTMVEEERLELGAIWIVPEIMVSERFLH